MKRHTKVIAILLLVALLLPGVAGAAQRIEIKKYVTVMDLNLRAQPNDTAKPTAYVGEGQEVEYMGESSNGWFELYYQGKVGYTHRGNVTSKSNYESTEKPIIHKIKVTGRNNKEYKTVIKTNLRTANDNKFRSVVLMPEGSSVKHLGTTANGWFKVAYGKQEGYIHRGDVTSKANYESTSDATLHDIKVTNPTKKEYVTIIDLNLRTGDSNEYRSVSLLEKGSSVKHLGETANGWFKVDYKGTKGYMYRGDVTSRSNYDSLHKKEDVDVVEKSHLQHVIKQAGIFNEEDFSPETWKTLEDSLIKGQAIMKDANASQREVNRIVLAIEDAIWGLEFVQVEEVDKWLLGNAIDNAKSMEQEYYTQKSWMAIEEALKIAEGLLIKEDASQLEVDRAYENLEDAIYNADWREPTYKYKLEDKVAEAKLLNEATYTDETWKLLKNRLIEAEAILEDIYSSQESIDEMVVKLEEAIDALDFPLSDLVKDRINDIQNEWIRLKPSFKEVRYLEKPQAFAPYILGKLTDETLDNALKITNFIRYMAYLPNDVILDEDFNRQAQAAALVNGANGVLTHYPEKPSDMDDDLYNLGKQGSRGSNIGAGYPTIIDSLIRGYMNDGDDSNIDRVGHRLWILSPKLKKTGFGFTPTNSGYYGNFTAMKTSQDKMHSNPHKPYDYVSWPSKTAIATQYFTKEFPWSVSLNVDKYSKANLDDIEVELTRVNDNKKWNFSKNHSDGYFNISTDNYGYLPFTLIFRPEEKPSYRAGDKYTVKVSNIRKVDGGLDEVNFETTFFNLKE